MGEVFFPLEEVFLSFMIMVGEVEVLGGKAKYLYILDYLQANTPLIQWLIFFANI